MKEFKEQISDTTITQFKVLVRDNRFTYFHYKNVNGKNKWNVICSCMDWITVSIRSLINVDSLSNDIDVKAMQVFSLISSIDIVSESIITLNSVINSTSKRVSPFKGKSNVFNASNGLDDDEYFKELRAQFGAHPVNLSSGTNEQWFASWPYESYQRDCDFEIRLYSNIVGVEDKTIKLHLKQLFEFLNVRYQYLNHLTDTLKIQYKSFVNECINTSISYATEPLEQLNILKYESEKRLDLEFINGNLNDLKILFSVSLIDENLRQKDAEFKMKLNKLVREYYFILQQGRFYDELEYVTLLDTDNLNECLSYEMPKLYACLYDDKYDPLIDYYFERLNDIDQWKYNFSKFDDPKLTLLKLNLLDRDLAI